MKYSFHMSMCVCITTCFLYVADANAATVQCCTVVAGTSGGCVAYRASECATVCDFCYRGTVNIGGNFYPVVNNSIQVEGTVIAEATICYDKYEAQSSGSQNCHANAYYKVTAPDQISATTCTYANNNNVRVACYAGYYYYEPTDSCKLCPEGFTSNDKNMGGIGDCYRSTDETFTNDYGTFGYESACYCDDACEDGESPESSTCEQV